jgi:hypothetical protein
MISCQVTENKTMRHMGVIQYDFTSMTYNFSSLFQFVYISYMEFLVTGP